MQGAGAEGGAPGGDGPWRLHWPPQAACSPRLWVLLLLWHLLVQLQVLLRWPLRVLLLWLTLLLVLP